MTIPTIMARLGRGASFVLVGLCIAHCGRFGYDELPLSSAPARSGQSDVDGPAGSLVDVGGSDARVTVDAGADIAFEEDAGDVPATDAGADATAGERDAGSASTLDDGLVAHWSIEEGTGGVLADSSPNHNDGQLVGSVSWADSERGSVLRFSDQNTNHITVPSSTSIDGITKGVSISAWVNTLGSGWEQSVLSRQVGQGSDQRYSLQIFQNRVQLQLGASRLEHTPLTLPVSTWFHLAATFDGAKATLYIDGLEVASAAMPSSLGTDVSPVLIGSRQEEQTIWSAMNGDLDSIRLYNRALTGAEVARLAQ